MRRSGRSNVGTPLTSEVFGVRPLAAVKPAGSLFCAIRLAMPFARLSDRLDAKNAQIVSKVIARRRRNKNAPVEMVAAPASKAGRDRLGDRDQSPLPTN